MKRFIMIILVFSLLMALSFGCSADFPVYEPDSQVQETETVGQSNDSQEQNENESQSQNDSAQVSDSQTASETTGVQEQNVNAQEQGNTTQELSDDTQEQDSNTQDQVGNPQDEDASPQGEGGNAQEQAKTLSIVCTIFPQYDWVRQIIGEEGLANTELTVLADRLVDLHSFNPTFQDIIKIQTADLFIYVGGDSDDWVSDALRNANPNIRTINLVELLGSAIVYEGHDHDEEDCDEDHDEFHADEHVWLSLRFAKTLCTAIAEALSEIDPGNSQAYKNRLDAYTSRLSALDGEYQAAVAAAGVKTVVFADRFPFRYMMDDYGITHYAAFDGCSTETSASFATMISLATRLDQLGLNVVMVTESSDKSIAIAVIENSQNKDRQILVLDSMQSVTSNDINNGTTYLSIMRNNLNVLKEALK